LPKVGTEEDADKDRASSIWLRLPLPLFFRRYAASGDGDASMAGSVMGDIVRTSDSISLRLGPNNNLSRRGMGKRIYFDIRFSK
jgi:hypothetical protein